MKNLSESTSKQVNELAIKMAEMWKDITNSDVEEFHKALESGNTSYLTEVMKNTLNLKELCVVESMEAMLIQNFQDTGVRVSEMVRMMLAHLAI